MEQLLGGDVARAAFEEQLRTTPVHPAFKANPRYLDIWREQFVSAGSITLEDPPVTLELEEVYAATDVAA